MNYRSILLLSAISLAVACGDSDSGSGRDDAGAFIGRQPDGSVLVPTNQRLTPAGQLLTFPDRPLDLAVSPDGSRLAVKCAGSVRLIDIDDWSEAQVLRYPDGGGSPRGIIWSADGRQLYVSGARGQVFRAGMGADGQLAWEATWEIAGRAGSRRGQLNSLPMGLALSEDGGRLYVCLSMNNSLGILELSSGKVRKVPTGIAPFDVALSDGRAFVTNWGGRRPLDNEARATGPSGGSRVLVDPRTGIANSGTVSVIDLTGGRQVAEIAVGLHPSGMALMPSGDRLLVACSNSDQLWLIDTDGAIPVAVCHISPQPDLPFGSAPTDLAITPDGGTVYATLGTNNALAVVASEKIGEAETVSLGEGIRGLVPTGWYPGAVRLDRSGREIYVASIKGLGSLHQRQDQPGHSVFNNLGSVQRIEPPGRWALARHTRRVLANNRRFEDVARGSGIVSGDRVPVPLGPGRQSVFEHVVYIIKENRTYDQVLGDLPQGNGDPSLVHFGREVSPNHHALAEEFVLLDNFYCSGINSADGHQWTDEAYATDYIERNYGDASQRSYPYDGDDALVYAASGFIWDNALNHGLTFRDYGEFVQPIIEPQSTWAEIWEDYRSGAGKIKIRAATYLENLKPYICPDFIGFPSLVSDQYRADVFLREFEEFERNGELPNLVMMLLPNDHTVGTRPSMPTPQAMVADNDLALGRIVEAITESRFWPKTCIFVVEDDPQAGLDHVDGHRTVAFVVSPYTRRGAVVSTNYNQTSMIRTMELILGLPPMNQLDRTALPMTDCFTETADLTPYVARPNIVPLAELNPPLASLTGPARHWAQKSIEEDLDDVDRADDDTLNRILWHAVMGYDVPYPTLAL